MKTRSDNCTQNVSKIWSNDLDSDTNNRIPNETTILFCKKFQAGFIKIT